MITMAVPLLRGFSAVVADGPPSLSVRSVVLLESGSIVAPGGPLALIGEDVPSFAVSGVVIIGEGLVK